MIYDEKGSMTEVVNGVCADITQELSAQFPDTEWVVEKTSCLRFCPEQKISFSISEPEFFPQGKLGMMNFSSAETLIQDFVRTISLRASAVSKNSKNVLS